MEVGTESNPLRVAIIGSGPAGFYTVSNFLRHRDFPSGWICLTGCPHHLVWSEPVWRLIIRKTSLSYALMTRARKPEFQVFR